MPYMLISKKQKIGENECHAHNQSVFSPSATRIKQEMALQFAAELRNNPGAKHKLDQYDATLTTGAEIYSWYIVGVTEVPTPSTSKPTAGISSKKF